MRRVTLAQALGARERQEDRAHAVALQACTLAVLADGMGGERAGDRAAEAAVGAVVETLVPVLGDISPQDIAAVHAALDMAVSNACGAVRALRVGRGGCTLVIAVVWDTVTVLRSVGDSRAWVVGHVGDVHPLLRPHAIGHTLLSCIPSAEGSDTVWHHGHLGTLVLGSDGVDLAHAPRLDATEIVRAQLERADRRQDNATAVVIPLGGNRAEVQIGDLVTVQPPDAPAASGLWMQTRSGLTFWPENPQPDQICLTDIAYALARQPRYAGHTSRCYSVAEHSVQLARWFMRQGLRNDARLALMHDAAEAYLCDIPRPLKVLLRPLYKPFEQATEAAIAARFGMPGLVNPDAMAAVKAADDRILEDERRALMSAPPLPWTPREPLGIRFSARDMGDDWASIFLELADELGISEVTDG